jgi:hypothetical protein
VDQYFSKNKSGSIFFSKEESGQIFFKNESEPIFLLVLNTQ